MSKYPIKLFRNFVKEVRSKIRIESYKLSNDLLKIARLSYREGGFSQMVSTLEKYVADNRFRLTTRAVLNSCDNWRYAIRDLEMIIEMGRIYSKREISENRAS